jgi:hypothetical protein
MPTKCVKILSLTPFLTFNFTYGGVAPLLTLTIAEGAIQNVGSNDLPIRDR